MAGGVSTSVSLRGRRRRPSRQGSVRPTRPLSGTDFFRFPATPIVPLSCSLCELSVRISGSARGTSSVLILFTPVKTVFSRQVRSMGDVRFELVDHRGHKDPNDRSFSPGLVFRDPVVVLRRRRHKSDYYCTFSVFSLVYVL